jgi:phosphatidate phosphatase PAH1
MLVIFAWLSVSGCAGESNGEPDGGNNDGDGGTTQDVDPDRFRVCDQAELPGDLSTEDWERLETNVIVASGGPDHSAQDVMAVIGQSATIPGKFAYGPISKDLEGEWIEVWMDDCSGAYQNMGRAKTNSDGRLALEISADDLPTVGAYALGLRVVGDNSWVRSTLRALPQGTNIMIFDIDGTLTTDDMELITDVMDDLYQPIIDGDYVPEARAGGVDLTTLRRDTQGYVLIYLTGRPYLMTDRSRSWLTDLGFPPGNLHLADNMDDILPSNESVGDYKAAYLDSLTSKGFVIEAAYGNASTDVYAYELAGVSKDRTYITGTNGGSGGTVDVGDDYLGHLPDAEGEAAADQPFEW